MQARGPLMIEHRLIEKMIALIKEKNDQAGETGEIDPHFVDVALDFIRTYADWTHHGKEEDILFRDLAQKDLSDFDRKMMDELVEEHVFGRKISAELDRANDRYRGGDEAALAEISDSLKTLVEFYPRHIRKEDEEFFPAMRNYLSWEEEQQMLAEFREFDRQMIHEKYRKVVDAYREPQGSEGK
ncbi:MAG: hemerythrin domain-containing protein [Desulfurivibrionaceae bacterium]